jgi:hypothetical protein
VTGRSLLRPAIFGVFDGLTSLIGVLIGMSRHPALILTAAIGLAVAGCVGMAAGEWLSDNDTGLGAAAVIGVATGTGTLLPALPFAALPPVPAAWSCGVITVGLGAAITASRARQPVNGKPRGAGRAAAETFGVLLVASAAVAACTLLTPAASL